MLAFAYSDPSEDEWVHLLHNMKDAGDRLVRRTGSASLGFKLDPENGDKSSDKDLLSKDHSQPYSLEGGSISLGDQFTECEQEEDITRKPDFGSISPTEKEFLLPKSLSEELTQEMRDLKQQNQSGDSDCKKIYLLSIATLYTKHFCSALEQFVKLGIPILEVMVIGTLGYHNGIIFICT